MRRVVVTGMGAITPIGNDVETFWNGLKEKKLGFGPITYFDTTDYKAKLAAEVKDFEPTRGYKRKTSAEIFSAEVYVQFFSLTLQSRAPCTVRSTHPRISQRRGSGSLHGR